MAQGLAGVARLLTPERQDIDLAHHLGTHLNTPAGSFLPNPYPMLDVEVPEVLRAGTVMLKVSAKKTIKTKVSLEYGRGQIVWETKKGGCLNIEAIREIRCGHDASYYRALFKFNVEYEPSWLTVIYLSKKSTYKMLHLIALDQAVFEIWKRTLEQILALRHELLGGLNQMRKRQTYWLKQNWNEADTATDSKLDFRETVALCRRLNISAPQSDIRAHFDIADSQRRGYLDFSAFQRFVKLMKSRGDLESLFQQISCGRKLMSEDQFVNFVQKVQHSEMPMSTLRAIYNKFLDDLDPDSQPTDAKEDQSLPPKQMTIEGFTSFLQSSDNSALSEKHMTVCQDMSLPICDYFISTSHNTYLVGNQLKGESTVEGYIRALQQGCRSVEIDCWDGEAGEPVVYHGRTLTRKLLLSDALQAISKFAFVASAYPLILSLEVHCQPSQQERLAELLRSCLGDALVDQRLPDDQPETLPSPQKLMYRILVKAKKPAVRGDCAITAEASAEQDNNSNSHIPSTTSTSGSSTSSDSDLKRRLSIASSALGHRLKRISSAMTSAPASEKTMGPGEHSPPGPAAVPRKSPLPPLTNTLSNLIIYTVGVKARGFNKLTRYAPEHVLSLSERTVNKFLKAGPLPILDLVGHTRGHLTRAYPVATRVFSSNFLPHRFWAAGIQLVACNWQTYDLGMELNSAFFNQKNGRVGYILKPLALRVKGKEKEAVTRMHRYELEITIVSVQQLPRLSVEDEDDVGLDPYVEVQVLSPLPSSTSPPPSTKKRTKVVKGNGFNPIYQEKFKIKFDVPGDMIDLCFLRLAVLDSHGHDSGKEDDVVLGRVSVCLGSLQPGYRHLQLNDDTGQQHLFASIFINSLLTKI